MPTDEHRKRDASPRNQPDKQTVVRRAIIGGAAGVAVAALAIALGPAGIGRSSADKDSGTDASTDAGTSTTDGGGAKDTALSPEASAALVEFTGPEMGEFTEAWPTGTAEPSAVDLLAFPHDAEFAEVDSDVNLVLSSKDAADSSRVVVQAGDLAILKALKWQCAWLTEFVDATEDGDTARAEDAAAQLERFPDLAVVTRYNPEVAEGYAERMEPILAGDMTAGELAAARCAG